MEILVALFIFGQTYADTTWTTYGANNENTHFQIMRGAIQTTPIVKWSYQVGNAVESFGPAVADIDLDGDMEIVIGTLNGTVYCFNGATGTIEWSYLAGGEVRSAPAIADVDIDSQLEIVFGSWGDNKVCCLDGVTGTLEWSYPTGSAFGKAFSPTIADVDGDGQLEVVIGGDKLYCLDAGSGILEWSYAASMNVALAVANLDGDAAMEIAFGGSNIYCIDGATGILEWSYPASLGVYCSPAIGDVDGDGNMEVVIGIDTDTMFCFDGATGTVEWSYSSGTSGRVRGSPGIADMDLDGTLEVVFGSYDMHIYCLNGLTGGLEWSYKSNRTIHRSVSIADLDMDDTLEVIFSQDISTGPSVDTLICLKGSNGRAIWEKGGLGEDIHDLTIADIDGDNCVEIIFGALSGTIWVLDDALGHIDCGSPSNVEENSMGIYSSQNGIEFKAIGKGIYLFTPNAIQVDINVYDVCGRVQQTIYKGVLSKGGHTFIPNIQSSGVYFSTLQSHNFKKSLKLIKF